MCELIRGRSPFVLPGRHNRAAASLIKLRSPMLLLSCKWTLATRNCALDPQSQARLFLRSPLARPLSLRLQPPLYPRYSFLMQLPISLRRRRLQSLLLGSDPKSLRPLCSVHHLYARGRPPLRREPPFRQPNIQRAYPCVKHRQAMQAPGLIFRPVLTSLHTPSPPRPHP